MIRKIALCFIFGLAILSSSIGLAQELGTTDRVIREVKIPQELMDRIPEDQLAQFIQCRERALNHDSIRRSFNNDYDEIGISKKSLSRIPEDQLFQFLVDRGYVLLGSGEHIQFDGPKGEHNIGSGPPSPDQIIKVLYILLAIVLLIIVLSMILGHSRKRGEQEIVISAIQQGVEIPYDLITRSRQRSFLRNAIIMITLSGGIFFAGKFDIVPSALGIIPGSIGLGLIIAAQLVRD